MEQPQLLCDGKDSEERLRLGKFLPKRPLTFAPGVKRLGSFTERFAFFTPAIPYLWGRFSDQLLFHFLELQGCRVDFFHMKFSRPLFQGMDAPNGDQDWNHVLWAVEQHFWKPFEDHILASVCTDSPQQIVIRYGAQDLLINDPLAVERQIIVTTACQVPVTVFGVRSNRGTVAIKEVPGLRPQVVWHEPDKQCSLYANVMFQQRAAEQAVDLMRTEGNHHGNPS